MELGKGAADTLRREFVAMAIAAAARRSPRVPLPSEIRASRPVVLEASAFDHDAELLDVDRTFDPYGGAG